MPIDRARAESAIEEFLRALGKDPASPDFQQTSALVADAWERDLLAGEGIDVAQLLTDESFPFADDDTNDVVILRDARVATTCPHHLLPAIGTATIAYAPGTRVAGLGTLVRVLGAYSRQLTLQERIGHNVVSALMTHLGARGAACVVRLKHTCLVARGEREDSWIETIATRGELAPGERFGQLLSSLMAAPRG